MDNSGEVVPPSNIHPKLMTNRGSNSNPTSARQHTPRSARSDGAVAAAVPSNNELAEAGVPPQDGVVRQLSARKQESGSLAGPRDVSGNASGRRAPAAIAAGSGIGEQLQLSEARQRRGSNNTGTPRSQQQQQQASRHAPYAAGSRASAGASREPIRPGRSPSKHNDPYGHVTSIVNEYRNNHISALEAQYKSVRSQSNAPVSHPRDPAEYRSESRPQQQQQQHEGQHEVYTPRSARQNSPQPRDIAAEYRRGGVPRAALDAPHIKYAEALENMNNARYSPRAARAYTPSASTAPTAFLPQVAQFIPDRFKYVEPSDAEKKRRREETLRLLQEWRERQKAIAAAQPRRRAASPRQQPPQDEEDEAAQQRKGSGKAGAGKRSGSKNRPRTRSQQPAAEKSKPATADGEERPEWDSTFQSGFGTPPRSPRTGGSRTPRSARNGRKSAGASRASSRKGRKSRGATPPATARGEATVNPNAFRRRLLFDITAPTLSVM